MPCMGDGITSWTCPYDCYMDVSGGVMRELGAQLQQLRNNAGLTLRDLEKLVGISNAKISFWENGRRLPNAQDLNAVLDKLNVSDDDRERILGLRREADIYTSPGQIASGAPTIVPRLSQLIEYEEQARRIVSWHPQLVPGLLQTRDYARAIMGDTPNTEALVKLRAGRQNILTRRRNAVELVAILDSEVLVRPVASSDVMIDQLHFLLEMAQRPNITLQIVSSTKPGFHPGLAGPFELIEFPTAKPVVHLEHYRSSLTLWEEEDVKAFSAASGMIQEVAMTPAESAGVIEDIVNGMETTT
jgi:transcriptional regulator with XRE-family HTH domain